jgi:hypothetical protein
MAARKVGTVTTGITLVQLQAEARPIVALAASAEAKAASAGGEDSQRKSAIGAARTLGRALLDWSTRQAGEVVAGKLALAKWREVGQLWKKQAESLIKDADERTSWLYKARSAVGGAAESAADAIVGKVRGLREQYNRIAALRATVEKGRKRLAGRTLPASVANDLFGTAAKNAEATFARLGTLLASLEKAVGLVTGTGTAKPSTVSGLGAVPVLAAGTVVATVTVAGSLAASLWAYFQHANEVTRAELAKLELELVREGKGADVAAMRAMRNEAEKNQQNDSSNPFATLSTIAKWAGATLVVGSVVALGRELVKANAGRPGAAP